MLKLPKGLKKNKKDKKKKNQELFTEDELEQFKRDQRARQQAEEEEAERNAREAAFAGHSSKPKTDDDEWSKFNQLTTGIDSILKKTQDDLDRIKESSFFQRVAPPKKVEAPEEVVASQSKQTHQTEEDIPTLTEEELEEQRQLFNLKEAVVELSESDSESEEADDIFDTNYIDTLTNGNVPLAYVPESPDDELNSGPDPFDTGYADQVIKGPEVSKRGKKIVNIGSAVEVLTGRVEKVSTSVLKRPRRGPQNLLLESFDQCDSGNPVEDVLDSLPAVRGAEEKPILTLLDDPADGINEIPIDLSSSLHLQYLKLKEEEEKEVERRRLELEKLKELEKDEFDDLAAESLNKKEQEVAVVVVDSQTLSAAPVQTNWSEFEAAVAEDEENEEEVDPFDTGFVTEVIREKSLEDDDDDFDPRADERRSPDLEVASAGTQATLIAQTKDLLSGSTSDLSNLSHIPVIPACDSVDEKEFDPFDTSSVIAIVQPKETEIKFLEKELLSGDVGLKQSLSDPDFDPRSNEKIAVPPRPPIPCVVTSTAERKSSLSLNIGAATSHKSVAFVINAGELSVAGTSCDNKFHKPLTPYYSEKSVDGGAAGESLSDLSDSDFDPRANDQQKQTTNKTDLLCVDETHDIKVLTPATGEQSNSIADDTFAVDPFDTSNVSIALLPGKAELKLIENELIDTAKTPETAVLDINSDSQELGLGGKVLTPQITLPTDNSFDDVDPFDTSFACNIAPGKAEIKVLESELIHK